MCYSQGENEFCLASILSILEVHNRCTAQKPMRRAPRFEGAGCIYFYLFLSHFMKTKNEDGGRQVWTVADRGFRCPAALTHWKPLRCFGDRVLKICLSSFKRETSPSFGGFCFILLSFFCFAASLCCFQRCPTLCMSFNHLSATGSLRHLSLTRLYVFRGLLLWDGEWMSKRCRLAGKDEAS